MQSGESFGRYRLSRRLGVGGMGEVYLAEAQGLDGVARKVAIKVVRQLTGGVSKRREQLRSLFVDEAKVSFLLNHPNVVQTYDIGEIEGHTFLVLEFVDGAGLERVLERLAERAEAMPIPLALYIGAQVARGLEYAHSFTNDEGRVVPIVHRDISPGNVLVSRRGQVKVADFGLAKSALRSVESESGAVKGKLAYMPPEQLRGAEVDTRADIYALGVMLYEMLAGAHPFGDVERLGYLDRLAMKKPPPPLQERRGDVSPHLSELVSTCMASAAEDRFSSTRDVVRLLDQHLRDSGVDSPEFDLAELMGRVLEAPAPQASLAGEANLFDQVLGQEIERQEGLGGLSTFFVAEGPKATAVAAVPVAAVPVAEVPVTEVPVTEASATNGVAATIDDVPVRRSRRALGLSLAIFVAVALGALVAFWFARSPDEQRHVVAGDASRGPTPRRDAGSSFVASRPAAAAEAPRQSEGASLILRSKPSGARLWLDDKPHGMTPVTLEGLPAGLVEVRLELDGHRPFAQKVTLQGGTTLTLAPSLERLPRRRGAAPTRARGYGFLSINSEPWAMVFIDGKKLRSTPILRHRLKVGRHRLLLRNPQRAPTRRRVVIRKGAETRVVVLLKKKGS